MEFQREVIGSEQSPSNKKLKHSKNRGVPLLIDAVAVNNNISWCIIADIDSAIEAAMPEPKLRQTKLILVSVKVQRGDDNCDNA